MPAYELNSELGADVHAGSAIAAAEDCYVKGMQRKSRICPTQT